MKNSKSRQNSTQRDLLSEIDRLEAENLELRARAGELPPMPCNSEGLPFSGPRMITARCRRGLSIDEMASLLHVDRRTIIGFETETIAPTMEQIGKMSMRLHFPLKFFFARDMRLVDPERVSWRTSPWVWNAGNMHIRKWINNDNN